MSTCSYVIGTSNDTRWTSFYNQAYPKQHIIERVLANEPPEYKPPCIMTRPRAEQNKYMSLWSTYGNVWRKALTQCREDYIFVYENDAIFPSTYAKDLADVTKAAKTLQMQVVWLDSRNGIRSGVPGCCTVGVMYHRAILADLVQQFELNRTVTSYWAQYDRNPRLIVNDTACLTDWYLGNLVAYKKWNAYSYGIIRHPTQNSYSFNMTKLWLHLAKQSSFLEFSAFRHNFKRQLSSNHI